MARTLNKYMFDNAVNYSDAKRRFNEASRLLGGHDSAAGAFYEAWNAGRQTIRAYHDEEHFYDIAGREAIRDWANAVRFRAGIYHDVVRQHVDVKGDNKKGFAPGIEEAIGQYICREGKTIYLANDPALKNDALFQAALALFNVDENERSKNDIVLSPTTEQPAGQNELLSTLYAIQQAKAIGISAKYILAEMAHIRATIPFQFESLEGQLHVANEVLPTQQRLSADEMKQVLIGAVRMANADLASFTKPFDEFIKGSRAMMLESIAGTPDNFDKPAFMLAAAMRPVSFLDRMLAGKTRIFHSAHGQPDAASLAADEEKAMENSRIMGDYLYANASAATLVAAIHVANTPEGETPSVDVSLEALLYRQFTLTPRASGQLSEHGKIALKECQKKILITDQVAAYLLETLGSEGIKKLAKLAHATGVQSAPAKPGMGTKESANDFLQEAAALFAEKGVDFTAVRHDLEQAMQSLALPFVSREQYTQRTEETKTHLQKLLRSDSWKGNGWMQGQQGQKPF